MSPRHIITDEERGRPPCKYEDGPMKAYTLRVPRETHHILDAMGREAVRRALVTVANRYAVGGSV